MNNLSPRIFNYFGFSEIYPSVESLISQRKKADRFMYKPKISIIIPTFNTPPQILKECILSILKQTYENFEICIADDNSNNQTKQTLLDLESRSNKIRTYFRKNHGKISRTSNDALKLATGEFVGIVDHDDMLWPNALFEVVKVLNRHPNKELIYTDEDQISLDGKSHLEPIIKPRWNYHLLRTTNYIVHFVVIKTNLIKSIGGFRSGYDGAQDYDLLLRATRKLGMNTMKIFHISKILYSWRRSPVSTAQNVSLNKLIAKKYTMLSQRKAIEDDLIAHGINKRIIKHDKIYYWCLEQ